MGEIASKGYQINKDNHKFKVSVVKTTLSAELLVQRESTDWMTHCSN